MSRKSSALSSCRWLIRSVVFFRWFYMYLISTAYNVLVHLFDSMLRIDGAVTDGWRWNRFIFHAKLHMRFLSMIINWSFCVYIDWNAGRVGIGPLNCLLHWSWITGDKNLFIILIINIVVLLQLEIVLVDDLTLLRLVQFERFQILVKNFFFLILFFLVFSFFIFQIARSDCSILTWLWVCILCINYMALKCHLFDSTFRNNLFATISRTMRILFRFDSESIFGNNLLLLMACIS